MCADDDDDYGALCPLFLTRVCPVVCAGAVCPGPKLALFIGVMGVAMDWGAFFWIRRSMAAAPKTAPAGP